ncbi:MAG TPA: sigma-70 family RNA polymerase sigma factor [Oscillatoriaceae cyanobacterium M33_DOE_052]|uniref:Sigma-70 family RNA polymerase sigma factor n=1 Tax=Planktothricoides sp. SpSt-374 TaxID=2282167 RepID=A0A7C3ZS29_9CYAN|nr:sigma-70 family RNA polymerase sigma factor [Oscillatoriaceae cyanobacterium M33_DOE_052]
MLTLPAEASSPQPSDANLVRECLRGNSDKFRELYQRYQNKVRSSLYQLCGAAVLDDLVQEVFIRAWKGLPKLKQPELFSTWLYRIAWNVAKNQRQAFARERSLQAQTSSHQSPTESGTNSEQALQELHYQDMVKRGLARLSLEHRSVLVLHDLQDMPQKEVAAILGIPEGTVKSRLFHARKGMRQFLQEEGVEL